MRVQHAGVLALWALCAQVHAVGLVANNVGGDALSAAEPILLRLDRMPGADEGRLAVLVDKADATALMQATSAQELIVSTRELNLRPGAHELALYLVLGPAWTRIALLRFDVASAPSQKPPALRPRIDINLQSQLHSQSHGDAPPYARETFLDATTRSGVAVDTTLGDSFTLRGAANVSGSSYRNEAPRYAQRRDEADKLDLSDYRFDLAHARGSVSLGHVTVGRHPYLLNQFPSRGLAGALSLGAGFDLAVAVVNGSDIVGFDQITGLYEQEHRVVTGTLGYEFDAQQPGRLRADVALVDAALRPRSDFNHGMISEAERTRGFGVRLSSALYDGRLRLDATFARKRDEAAPDVQLSGGYTLTEITPEQRAAYALEASVDVVRGAAWLGERWPLTATLQARQERIDPLYRPVGLTLGADQLLRRLGLQLQAGPLAVQLAGGQRSDNLADLPAMPSARADTTQFSLSLPLSHLWENDAAAASRWWPRLAFSAQRTDHHPLRGPLVQPEDGQPYTLPAQKVAQQQLSLGWSGNTWAATYAVSAGKQDNRQPGREGDDVQTVSHQASANLALWPTLNLNTGLSRSRQHSALRSLVEYRDGLTWGIDWRFADVWSLGGQYAITRADDSRELASNRGHQTSTQIARRFKLAASTGWPVEGQWFLRHALQNLRVQDNVFGAQSVGLQWSINAGVGVSYQ